MFFGRNIQKVVFRCSAEDKGVIAEPVPAKSNLPAWFKKLPAVSSGDLSVSDNGLTVKRCMPFLDAMTTGWILPLAATVRMDIKNGGTDVSYGWEFDKTMVSNHNSHQIAGHPLDTRPPSKFHNFWTLETPPGWSCLFVPPLNRHQPLVQILAGVVDTDTYKSLIHFPFLPTGTDGLHVMEKGMPLVQVIPFKRQTTALNAEVRAESPAEAQERNRILRNTQATAGWYRNEARAER